MIVAVQAGDKDRDPAQTRQHMRSFLEEHTVSGDSVVYVAQPSTMMDQVLPVSDDLGLDVIEITANFMLHGAGALEYAIGSAVLRADAHLLIGGSDYLCPIDRDFLSHVSFFGCSFAKTVVPYERIEVL